MYPWQTFRNSSASVRERKQDSCLRDRDKVFFLGGAVRAVKKPSGQTATVKTRSQGQLPLCHEVEVKKQ